MIVILFKLCILGGLILISLKFINFNYHSYMTSKGEKSIVFLIFAFMSYNFFTYFFKIFYITEDEAFLD